MRVGDLRNLLKASGSDRLIDFAAGYHMPITKLRFSNVGPFDDIEFEFDPQVNVFTGPNNSGKSTALWVLGDITVYPFLFPQKLLRREGVAEFKLHLQNTYDPTLVGQLPCKRIQATDRVDPEEYWTVERSQDHIRAMTTIGYSNFIPALRRSTDFRSPGPTPAQTMESDGGHRPPHQPLPQRVVRNRLMAQVEPDPELRKRLTLVSEDASLVSDEAVIQEIIDLDYRSYLRDDPARRNIIVKIGEIASEVTEGFPIQFSGVGEDEVGFFPEFSTVDGFVPLNTLSQGTQSIVQWLAHLIIGYAAYYDFPKSLKDKPGVLIVDEIDAHLHPSWQRRIIPALTKHFPSLQIFCSTHSPLMLAGLKAGQVQLLQRDENNKVTVSRNEDDLVAWSADEILRNFLGVRDPTDQETVNQLERLRELQGKRDLSPEESEELESLSDEVSDDLLSGPVAAQVNRFIQALEQAKAGGDL